MPKRILVAYDTLNGTTVEVAKFIGDILSNDDTVVDVKRATRKLNIADYTAVVIGAPVIFEKLPQHTCDFLERNRAELAKRSNALFIFCLATLMREDGRERAMLNYINPILETYPELSPVSIGVFTGMLDYSKYPANIAEAMRGFMGKRGAPVDGRHDYRDWDVIRTWALDLKNRL